MVHKIHFICYHDNAASPLIFLRFFQTIIQMVATIQLYIKIYPSRHQRPPLTCCRDEESN